jgi:hypothetical protein
MLPRCGKTQQFEPTRSLLAGTTGHEPHLRGRRFLEAADSQIGSPNASGSRGALGRRET